jgi:hypothetical protein
MKKTFLIALIAISSYFAIAEENKTKNTDWQFNANALVRPELDGRDFSDKTYAPTYTGMRFRLGVDKTFFENMQISVQFQDARYFGQEGNPSNNIKNIDLYQGFIKISEIFGTNIYAQAGKFEMLYSDQRIFGNSSWNLNQRSWDGIRFGYESKDLKADLFSLTANWSGVPAFTPAAYSYPSKTDTSLSLYGFYAQYNISKDMKLDVYSYLEENRKKSNTSDVDLSRLTAGLRYGFAFDGIFGKIEGAYQMGSQKNLDIAAYLLALNLGYDMGSLKASFNLDMSSGTNADDRTTNMNLFDAAYSTKHSIQGYMDYFSNINNSTGGYGLNDYYLRLQYQEKNSPFSAHLDAHYFMTNQVAKLQSGDYSDFGQEIDVVLGYKLNKFATIEWGGSVFLPGDLMKEMWIVPNSTPTIYRDDMSFWSYLALKVNIF